MTYIYVLECQEGKYYVGKTGNLFNRIPDHISGAGAAWTKKYSPIKLIETYEINNMFDEDICTLKYMQKHGIDNVRGGIYCRIILNNYQLIEINKHLRGANSACYRCGHTGHYVNNCYAKTDVNGNKLSFKSKEIKEIKDLFKSKENEDSWDKIDITEIKGNTTKIKENTTCILM